MRSLRKYRHVRWLDGVLTFVGRLRVTTHHTDKLAVWQCFSDLPKDVAALVLIQVDQRDGFVV